MTSGQSAHIRTMAGTAWWLADGQPSQELWHEGKCDLIPNAVLMAVTSSKQGSASPDYQAWNLWGGRTGVKGISRVDE